MTTVARLAGSFDFHIHDVNQPLRPGDSNAAGDDFRGDTGGHHAATETALAWQIAAAHGAAQRVWPVSATSLPGSRCRSPFGV